MIFKKLYEDHELGTINDEQFRMLSQGYTEEQNKLKADISELNNSISELKSQTANTSRFILLAKSTPILQLLLGRYFTRLYRGLKFMKIRRMTTTAFHRKSISALRISVL